MSKVIFEHILDEEWNNGIHGFISWERLAKLIKQSGEVRTEEKLTNFTITENGINFGVRKTFVIGS